MSTPGRRPASRRGGECADPTTAESHAHTRGSGLGEGAAERAIIDHNLDENQVRFLITRAVIDHGLNENQARTLRNLSNYELRHRESVSEELFNSFIEMAQREWTEDTCRELERIFENRDKIINTEHLLKPADGAQKGWTLEGLRAVTYVSTNIPEFYEKHKVAIQAKIISITWNEDNIESVKLFFEILGQANIKLLLEVVLNYLEVLKVVDPAVIEDLDFSQDGFIPYDLREYLVITRMIKEDKDDKDEEALGMIPEEEEEQEEDEEAFSSQTPLLGEGADTAGGGGEGGSD